MNYPKQEGGTHYEVSGQQHWDIMEQYDIAYLEATATKYIIRWDKKGTAVLDLRKAASYLERATVEGRGARRTLPETVVDALVHQYKLGDWERVLLVLILVSGSREELDLAATNLRGKADQVAAAEEKA